MAKKGGKKNKKKKAKITGPIPVTTTALIKERGKVLCPRLGDVYDRNEHVENILNVSFIFTFFIILLYLLLNLCFSILPTLFLQNIS